MTEATDVRVDDRSSDAARPRFALTVSGRKIVVLDDPAVPGPRGPSTPVIAVCTPDNRIGEYECRYRLRPRGSFGREDLAGFVTLLSLQRWLDTVGEPLPTPRSQRRPRRLPAPVPLVTDDEWLPGAVRIVDATIDALLARFVTAPDRHTVTGVLDGLAAALAATLGAHPLADGSPVAPVRRDWPAPADRPVRRASGRRGRRSPRVAGRHSLVVLSPAQLRRATPEQLVAGTITASVVIEVGLDDGWAQLRDDYDDLRRNRVPAGYLVYLSRSPHRDMLVEHDIDTMTATGLVKVGYAHVGGDGHLLRPVTAP